MAAESALGRADALLEQGMTRCPPGAPSSPILCISKASTWDTVPFPVVIMNSFSPWTLATSPPPCRTSVPASLVKVVIEENTQAPESSSSRTSCRGIALGHRSLLNHFAAGMCLVYVLRGVISALLTGPGLLSDGQTQSDVGASCYRRYTSPAVVLRLVIFSLVSSKIPP